MVKMENILDQFELPSNTSGNFKAKCLIIFLKLMSETGLKFSSRINTNKIVHQHAKLNKRKYAITLRVSRTWNKLPDTVVNAPTLNTFKNRLYRYWKNQDLYFDNYKSDIQWDCHVTSESLEVESEESDEEEM